MNNTPVINTINVSATTWVGPNPADSGKNRDETLVAEIRELRAEVAKLRSESRAGQQAIAVNTGAAARTLKNWDGNGQPPVREDDA